MSLFEPGEIDELRKRCPSALTFTAREDDWGMTSGIAAVFPSGARHAVVKYHLRRSDRARFIREAGDELNAWWNTTGRNLKPEDQADAR